MQIFLNFTYPHKKQPRQKTAGKFQNFFSKKTMYVCMYVCMYYLPHYNKIFTSYYKNQKVATVQYNMISIVRLKRKRKTLLITVAGIALKGQNDLISIIVPLEV